MDLRHDPYFSAIQHFYGSQTATRSGVPLIHHIREGLAILDVLEAPKVVQQSYCVHPLFQSDTDLSQQGALWVFNHSGFSPKVLLLVMEYRNQANAWLSDKVFKNHHSDGSFKIRSKGGPSPGPLEYVKQMLIADKVQNYKDFILYHKGIHQRSEELDHYFKAWLSVLDVSEGMFQSLFKVAEGVHQ